MDDINDYGRISALMLKFLQDDLTEDEKSDFNKWLDEQEGNRALLESFQDTAKIQKEIDYLNTVNTDDAWQKVSGKTFATTVKPSSTLWWRWVAAAVLLTGIALALSNNNHQNENSIRRTAVNKTNTRDIKPGTQQATLTLADGTLVSLNGSQRHLKEKNGVDIQAEKGLLAYHDEQANTKAQAYNTLKTPKAGQYELLLPDGTRVWLNAASSLRFPISFEGTERRVELTGEAYFEVAKSKKMPFIVSFSGTEVKVLGTHFNINNYTKLSTVTLLEGAVRVTRGSVAKLLQPGERAVVTQGGSITTGEANTYKDVAWKEGLFYFDQDNLGDIMERVARWYDITVVFQGKQDNRRFNGTIRRQASLTQILEMLSAVSGNTFTLKDRTVLVHSK